MMIRIWLMNVSGIKDEFMLEKRVELWLLCLREYRATLDSIISFHYFCAPRVKWGVKWSENLYGTQFFGFQPLFFSHNWINFEKPSQKWHFMTYFRRFWRLFNSRWKTAAETQKFKFLEVFCFIWHPAWPQVRESSWDKFY